ncbi:hypothetical protein [Cytobacillus sp. IB215316]|uniref:hypothetical protein n=1 Tax=Cytobacillus sp. IB215316 TaxID=3097354 RepID=UPI002A13E9E9|nr:hypothetical protein [Cytobacillus sp. IB215316]MDX8362461.1 hypothetical protein [Cytobacillus sp. IB215316]
MAQTQREVGEFTVKLNVEVPDVITGLRAIQREAKKATQALRELESICLSLIRSAFYIVKG